MNIENLNKYNKCLLTMLFTLVATLLLFISPNTVSYASEISTADNQTLQTNEAADVNANNTDDIIENENTDKVTEDQELILEEGYFLDEQGQVFYDDSKIKVEEPIIEEIEDEEIDDEVIVEDSEEVKEEAKVADKKASQETKKDQTKVEKATVVKKPTYSEAELRLLACLVYAEAGNQSYKGMLGVANVVINRAKSDVYWHVDTIKEVVYDRKWSVQFSVTIKNSKTGLSALDKALKCYDTGKYTGSNGTAQKKAMDRAIKAAKDALEGKNNIGGYLCFTNKREASSIKKKYSDYLIIGDHIFYRTK